MMNGVLLFLPRVANCYIQRTTSHISGGGGAGGWLARRVKGRFCCEPMPRARGLVVRHVEGGGQGGVLQGERALNPVLNVGKQAEVEQTSGAGWELGYSFSVAGLLFPYHLVGFIIVQGRWACNFILVYVRACVCMRAHVFMFIDVCARVSAQVYLFKSNCGTHIPTRAHNHTHTCSFTRRYKARGHKVL